VLGRRLIECVEAVNGFEGSTAAEIFGAPDDMKFRSCLTLFGRAEPANAVFPRALEKYFGGVEDAETLARISGGRAPPA
jgi:uncharacterized protein (DUF1810 family)